MSEQRHLVFTVGHSTHPFDRFVALLTQHGVTTVADVRSAPFSRFNPQFNKDVLEENLRARGLDMCFWTGTGRPFGRSRLLRERACSVCEAGAYGDVSQRHRACYPRR